MAWHCFVRRLQSEVAAKLEGDEATGARIVATAVEEPLKRIAINAGLEGGVIVDKVRNLPKPVEASTLQRASTRICSKPVLSTPPR